MKERFKSIRLTNVVIVAAIFLLCMLIPSQTSSYMLRVLNIAMITYLCVLSVYVLLGMCGQNSFAQAGLWGIGAYITANVVMKLGYSSITAFIISVIGTALFTFVIGFAFFRLRMYYFTFATVGLMTILNGLFMNWKEATGGALGISNIPEFRVGGFVANTETSKYFVILATVVLISLSLKFLFHSPLGRSFMAIRDNEIAANCLGINSLLTKSIAFAISGALCGAAGALYAFLSGYLSYQSFTYQQSTMYLIMIMLGGTISPVGAVIGTLIISLLQEWVRPLQNYMQLIYGAGIMILMIVQPEGILGGGKVIYDKYIKPKKTSTKNG
ncbi:MAG: branched-chain amino acid transporter permease [Lachnospiraceae bacterium]|jgi:branched-chain amino acid transport system permease protein|nr:branched-chain amino acid transporter permease [Anaerocolumna sp.]MDF2609240.1 branched-chain amino acid transporter permease [Lachnospiraceae bacterium]